MTIHTAAPNDTLFTIALQHGFRNWRAIYDHPSNERLRQLRPDPMVLAPGDTIFVPDKQPSKFNGATGRTHRFRLAAPKCFVAVCLQDEEGEPYAGCKYELTVNGQTLQGVTSDVGLVSHEVRHDAKEATLTLWTDPHDPDSNLEWTLEIGALDPIDTIAGVQWRLQNLGYLIDEITGAMDDATRTALSAFQRFMGHAHPVGELDEATRQALSLATAGG